MNEPTRSAAKRRASFVRADRLAREAANAERRQAERAKADDLRKTEAAKAAERRIEQTRKQAEQRRLERLRSETRRTFNRQAEDRKAAAQRLDQQRRNTVRLKDQQRDKLRSDETRKQAEAFVKDREKRELADQQAEHRRQTDRLRTQHRMEVQSHKANAAGSIGQHAQQMRNIDLAEQRDLKALGARRNSLSGRITGLIRGQGRFEREEQKIVDRHEAARMTKHRDLEALKDRQFQGAQDTRLRQAHERKAIFDAHCGERRDLVQAQTKDRLRRIELQQQLHQQSQHQQTRDRTLTQAFEHGRGHERKPSTGGARQ